MKLIIDKESFKNFYKVILTCSKLGEELYFDCRHDYITIKSVNDARSQFFFTKFERRFFEEFQVPEQIECKFKAKSCVVPFKSAVNLEKNLTTLEFFVDKDKDGATFQMNFDTEDMTVHEVAFINTTLQVDVEENATFDNYLMAKNRSLINLFKNFPNIGDYCVMTVFEDKICFETYNFKLNEVRTAFSVKSEMFVEYQIKEKIRCVFVLRSMKTFLQSVDPNANCYFYFEEDNCPIHVIIKNRYFENKFIIASIDVDIDSINDQTASVQAPRELQSSELERDSVQEPNDDTTNDELKNENEDDHFSSSFATDQSVSLDNKPNDKSSVKVKNDRYKSIYSTETEDDMDTGSLHENANENASQGNNSTGSSSSNDKENSAIVHLSLAKSRDGQSQAARSPSKQATNGETLAGSQIRDSQLMFDNEDISFGSIDSDCMNERGADQTSRRSSLSNVAASSTGHSTSIVNTTVRSSQIVNPSEVQSNATAVSTTLDNDDQTSCFSNKTYLAPTDHPCSAINSDPMDTIAHHDQNTATTVTATVTSSQLLQNHESQEHRTSQSQFDRTPTNNQATTADQLSQSRLSQSSRTMTMNDQTTVYQTSANQTTNSVLKRSSNSHSTQENDNESVKMNSIDLSRINASMNADFTDNDDEWMNFEVDLMANETVEQKAKRQKSAYDDFLNKMPAMCEADKHDESEQANLFAEFMNKQRSLLP